MMSIMRDFPEDFLWGSATAAHQVEGGNYNNDWWEFEHRPDAKVAGPSGDAIDQYHCYRSDFELLAELGQNCHRLSLEWSRIEPAPGEWSQVALDHYRRVLETVAECGMTAFVTVHHFTNPRWFAERGGWLAPDAVDVFARYCDRVATELSDLMPWTCTINEPQVVAFEGYRQGYHPPGHRDRGEWMKVTRTFIRAHRAVVDLFPRAGFTLAIDDIEGDPELAAEQQYETIDVYLEDLRGDFVGIQYYTRAVMDADSPDLMAAPPEGTPVTQMGWEIHPEGLLKGLRMIAAPGLPVVVTENGIATADDDERIDYLEVHLRMVARALAEGLDIRGYIYWTSFDNFEWAEGYRPTFGLVEVDREDDLRRIPRPSAHAFGRVARSGRLADLRAAG